MHGARRHLLGVEPHALHDLLDDALLVVFVENGKGAGQALVADFQRFDVAAQNAHAERVEGGDQRLGQRRVAQQPVHALGHLAGGLVGEGDGQDGVGRDVFLADEPGDAMRDDAGFARSGAGQDEQRAFGSLHRGALFGIQMFEERLQGVESGGKVPVSSVPFGAKDPRAGGATVVSPAPRRGERGRRTVLKSRRDDGNPRQPKTYRGSNSIPQLRRRTVNSSSKLCLRWCFSWPWMYVFTTDTCDGLTLNAP